MHRPEYYAVLKHPHEIGVAVMTTSGREMLHIQPVTAKWLPGANLAAIPEELDLVRFAFHDRTPPVRCNMFSAGFERQRRLTDTTRSRYVTCPCISMKIFPYICTDKR